MRTLLGIGDFSRMTFISVKALRHYHEVGLLPPAEIDGESGYRRYDLAQVPRAQVIRRLRDLGMPLDDVRAVIDAPDVDTRNTAISAHLRRMEGELERTRETVRSLRLLLDEDAPAAIDVSYRTIGPMLTMAIHGRLAFDEMPAWLTTALVELRTALDEGGFERVGADAALFSSELLEEQYGEIVALVPVAGPAAVAGRVRLQELPAVEYAIATHVGSVESLDRTYAALGAVVAERAIGVQGPIREDFMVGAFDAPEETAHRTDICWPVFQTASAAA